MRSSRGVSRLWGLGILLAGAAMALASDGASRTVREMMPAMPPPIPSSDGVPLMTLELPFLGTTSASRAAFAVSNTGSGVAGQFTVSNASGVGPAVLAVVNRGSAVAVRGEGRSDLSTGGAFVAVGNGQALLASAQGAGTALRLSANGTGFGGYFTNTATNPNELLYLDHQGAKSGLYVRSSGASRAATFEQSSTSATSPAVFAFHRGPGIALSAQSVGSGEAVNAFQANSASSANALTATESGTGWAGEFRANGVGSRGVLITTQGAVGLQVVGGSKNAVVGTSSGARALYTEESSEVWFTDYGFGQLENGRARIAMDRTFGETVNLEGEYHVFVQSYGDAHIVVRSRTHLGFEVVRRGAGEDARFSFRIVARRRGFERDRLERAPWADASVRRGRIERGY